MSLFAPQKMSLNVSKNWASKSRRLMDLSMASTLLQTLFQVVKIFHTRSLIRAWQLTDIHVRYQHSCISPFAT